MCVRAQSIPQYCRWNIYVYINILTGVWHSIQYDLQTTVNNSNHNDNRNIILNAACSQIYHHPQQALCSKMLQYIIFIYLLLLWSLLLLLLDFVRKFTDTRSFPLKATRYFRWCANEEQTKMYNNQRNQMECCTNIACDGKHSIRAYVIQQSVLCAAYVVTMAKTTWMST